jgi:4-phytase/acid phosphatase
MRCSLVLAALSLLVTPALLAQPARGTTFSKQLKFVLVLSRHGVRPPLKSNQELRPFAAQPWPEWKVPLGYLTDHGALALTQMGAWMREVYDAEHLFEPGECPAATSVYAYADTDERNVRSTQATFEGFAPKCAMPEIHTYTGRDRDPFFNLNAKAVPHVAAAQDRELVAQSLARLGDDPQVALTAAGEPQLTVLAHLLSPDAAHPAADNILTAPVSVTADLDSASGVKVRGPLAEAGTLAEDILLEYTDDMPMKDVAWGRLGNDEAAAAPAVQDLGVLAAQEFLLSIGSPRAAALHGNTTLARIVATLDRAAREASPTAANDPAVSERAATKAEPLGPAGTRFVYLSGHDTNLHALQVMMHLTWADPRLTYADTPPDSQIVFELWQWHHSAEIEVRAYFRAQTLLQVRQASTLSAQDPPVLVPLTLPGCEAQKPCMLTQFAAAAETLIAATP